MAKTKRKSNSGLAFLLTFVAFLLIFGGIMVWGIGEFIQQSHPEEPPVTAPTTAPAPVTATPHRLLLITEDGGEAEGFVLLSAEASTGHIRVISLPRETATVSGTTQSRLFEMYKAEGVSAVKEQVERVTGMTVDHYAVLTYQNLQKLVTHLSDGVIFTLPEEVTYTATDGSTVHMKSGARTLSATQVTDLLRYTGWHSGRRGRADIQGQMVAALLDQYLVPSRFDEQDTEFNRVVNLVRSDVLVSDFTAARGDLLTLAKHNNRSVSRHSSLPGEFVGAGEAMRFEPEEPAA